MKEDRRKRWREKNPYRYRYQGLKHRAGQRGVLFNLTFEQYLEIPNIDEYMMACGRGKWDLTLDRVDPRLGYTAGNIQVLPNVENNKKRWREPVVFDPRLENNDIACPF